MHGIAASRARNQQLTKKYAEKHVVFAQSLDTKSKIRSSSMSSKSASSLTVSTDEKPSKIIRKGSSPRSGLLPADIFIPRVSTNGRTKSFCQNDFPKEKTGKLQIPDIFVQNNLVSNTNEVVELASEEDILKATQNKQRNNGNNLTAVPPNVVRRHASLAVDNPTRQVRQNILKRGSMTMDQIKSVVLDDVYKVYKQLGSGRFGYIKLAEHKQYKRNIAIKFFPRPQIRQSDFVREYNYSYFLSPHPNIIDTYDGMYQTSDDSAFFFVQEFSTHASLREAIENSSGGIGEDATKLVLSKLLSAIEFMHDENLVHRNLKAENVLIFDKEFNKVKLTDFGLTRKIETTIKYGEAVTPYHAPELCEILQNESITLRCSLDIWSLGIIFYYCLKGKFPWQKASILNKSYWEWEQYLKRKIPALPKRWEFFSDKSMKILKKCLNPKPKDRWTAKDMRKCLEKVGSLKNQKESPEEHVYYPAENFVENTKSSESKHSKKKGAIHQWINSTLTTMAEISEQVVSARND